MTKLYFSALEPRVLLDAAAVATVASEVTHHDQAETKHQADAQKTSDASSDASSQFDAVVANLNPETATGRVLVVIDSRVEGAEEFAASLEGKADVLIVDSDQSGAKAIADALASGTDVSGLHIISHGGDGSFELGSDHIDSAALASEVGSEISSWSSHLSAGADILLYGCNIAKDETGKQFVDTFSSLTGADIAASDDVTGNTDLGGDWDLEYATGQITATLPADSSALHSISQLLADPVDPVTGHQPTISGMGVSQNGVEDTAVTLGGISVGDIDHDASNVGETLTVTITVVDGSSNPTGSIALNGTAGLDSVTGDNGNTITLVGKQDAINAALNNMVLTPSENYNGTVNVHLTVNDGTTGDVTDTITVNLSPVNDAPDMSPSPVSVDEGGSVIIGTDIFNLTDPELGSTQTPNQEVFQVTALPTEGVLKLNGNNLLVGSTFSLQDVISGKLTYKHDGTDIIVGSNDVDGFKVTVNDGGGSGNVGPFDVTINIAPVNQAPTVDGSPTVHEGEGTEDVYNSPGTVTQAAEIGSLLNISGGDADSADDLANMTITISEVDNQGHGTLFIDTDGDGIFNSGIDQIITGSVTISGADIGKLKFAHNGTEPDGNNPSFKITVTDGGGGAGDAAKASVSKTITIGVIGNDDNPEIDTNSPQTVDAGVVTVLSSANLKVTDIDDTSGGKQLVYKITSLPTYGELRLNGVILSVGDRFSQDDLDNGRVTYFQTAKVTAADRVSGENYVADGFSFEVRDSQLRSYNQAGAEGGVVDPTTGNIKTNSFELRINGDWTGDGGETPDGSVTIKGTPVNSGLQVTEEDGIVGGADTGTITSSMLNYILQATSGGNTYDIASSDTIYRLTDLPTNGKLYLNGVELHVFDSFTQADIDANNVTFVHDGSEDHQSSFGFSLSVGVNEVVKTTFSLRATATNDAPTVSGGTATVAEGSAVGLTTSSLGMADADTSNEPGEPSDANDEAQADDLYIQITTLPQNGTLQYLSNGTWIDIQAGDWISAKLLTGDENTTGIRYLQTVDAVASDSFEYRVRDDFKDDSGNDTDNVRSSVADPDANHVSGNGTVNLTITSVDNHAPTINGNPKAYEGQGSENLYNDNSTKTQAADIGGQITIADFDSYDDDTRLTVSITNVDTHGVGTLFLDVDGDGYFGAGDTQITGDTANLTIAQLKTLKFIHDGAEPSDATDPSFTLTVTDSGGGFGVGEALSTSKNIVIDILANDDYSSLDTNNTAQIDAGQSFVIDTSYLSVSDVDDTSNGTQLVYEVTDLPDHGELRLNGVRLTLGDRFSQADVAAGKLVYVQNGAVDDPDAKASGTAFTADSFDFKVYDSQQRVFNNDGADGGVVDPNNNHEIATNTFNIEIQGDFAGDGGTATSGDPVTIVDSTNNGIDVVEGDGVSGGSDTHTIASSELNYELKYTQGGSEYTVPADATVYRISSLPTNGTLYVDGKAIDSLYDSFTQDDIDNNRVVFVHDGGEIHQGSFGFTISVGTSEAVAGTFALRATATNDAPTATGGTLADVTQGATVGITTGALGMSDVDVANETGEPGSNPEASSDDLFFKVTDLPDGGKLQYYDDGTSSWVDVGANDWLSAGLLTGDSATTKLRYVNDSGIALSADNFKFIVRDDLSTVDGAKQTAADPATGNVSAEKQVSWNIVASVNHAPTIDGAPSVYEGQGTEDVYNNPGTKTSAADIGGQITIGDVDTSDSGNLGIVISDIDTHGLGTLFLDANGNGQVDSGEAITGTTATLTMAEFKTLKFAHNGTEPDGTTKPEFKLTVTDAGGEPGAGHELTTAKTIQIDVIANDDHSVLDTNKPTTVQAGVSTVITRNFLHVSDVDDTSNGTEIVYHLTSLPTYGELRLNGNLLTVNSTFTQADIDAGRLTYVQTKAVTDSDNSTAGTSYTADSFNFEVRDSHSRVFNNAGQAGGVVNSADGTIATNTFNLQIQGSYDPDAAPTGDPVVIDQSSVNTGIEVYEGDGQFGGTDNDTVTITSQNLSYTLKATQGSSEYTIPAEGTVYRLTTLPQNGTLYLNGKALGIYDSFTQADINNGLLKFTHDGGETHHGSFNFSISIGTGQLADDRAQGTFTITAIPVNDAPTADGGSVPTIGEGATVTITTGNMKIGDVDNQAEADEPYGEAVIDDLYFQIVDLPDTGTLQYKDAGGNWVDVQAGDWLSASLLTGDKNTTGLRYIHDGTENFTDSFQFRVRDDLHSSDGLRQTATDPATINTSNNATVNFTIAPLNDAPISDQNAAADSATTENGRTTVNEVLEVSEGGTGTISDSYLVSVDPDNAPETLQYRITQNVTSGVLYLDGKRLGVGSVFTQADIDAGRLTYIHDGSEVRSDNFQYIVSDSVNDHTWTVDGTKAASQFDIIVPASGYANDVPKITRAGADYDVYGTNTFDMNGKFTLSDPDLVVVDSPGETDFVSVTVVLKDKDGNAVDLSSSGDLALGSLTGITVTSDVASSGSITFQGSLADVQAALNSMNVVLPDGDHDTTYTVEVSVDDRLRDSSGNLTAGANGSENATVNQDGSTINDANNIAKTSVLLRASRTNTPPTIDVPNPGDARVTYEDTTKTISGIRIDDTDAFGKDVTVTLSVSNGRLEFSAPGDVTISGNDSGTVTLTGSVTEINAIMDQLTYAGNQDYVGADVLNITVNDLGNSGGPAETATTTVNITVKSVNDAPTITNGTTGRIDVVNNNTYTFGDSSNGFIIDDIDLDGGAGDDAFVVTVRILDPNGNPVSAASYTTGSNNIVISSTDSSGAVTVDGTYNGVGAALRISGSEADINNYLKGLQVNFGDFGEQNQTYKVQVIVDDRMPASPEGSDNNALESSDMANGGPNPDQTPYESAPNIDATPIDPYTTDVSASNFQYNVAAVTRDVFLTAYNTPAKVTGNNFSVDESNGVINVNGSNANLTIDDVDDLGQDMSVTLTVSAGSTITGLNNQTADGAGITGLGGTSVTLTGFNEAELNAILKTIVVKVPTETGDAGSNSNFNGDITLTVAVNDLGNTGLRPDSLTGDTNDAAANPGDYAYADGSSAELVTTRTITITVNPTNDAPTISAGTTSHNVTESNVVGQGTPETTILDNVTIGDVDLATTGGLDANTFGKGQIVVSLTGAQAGEVLSVSGSLAGIDSVTGGTGGSALTINLTDTATLAEVKAIVEAIKYQSTGDIVTGTRNITVNLYDAQGSSQDGNIQSGGDAGASRLSASIAATVTVTEQNDPPSISGSPSITAKEDIDYVFQVSDFNFTQTGGESTLDTELGQITVKSLPDGAKGDLLLQTGTDGNGDPVYSAVTANQTISAQDIADGKLIYRSDLNLNQSQADNSFTYSVWDKGHASDTTIRESADGTMQINVDQQNDAPVLDATNKTASATESATSATGTDPVQIVSGVSLSDIDLSTTDGLSVFGKGTLTVEIVGATTATKEYLTLSGSLPAGVTVVDSQGNPISLSSTVGDNKLVFSLDADTTAAEVQSLMESLRYHTESDVLDGARTVKFTINDGNNEQANGNTAGGPTSLEATLNATVTITEVNDPPAGGDQTVVTLEDTDYALKVSDFNYTQPGDETDTFKAVRIDTLPGSGTLKLNGVAITAGTVVSVADITSGNLVYSPAENVNGDAAATFTFSVQDSRDGFDTSPNTITVDITPQNDAPTFNDTVGVVTSVNESTAANTGTSPVAIITGANIGDIDLLTTGALSNTVYGAGKITVAVTGATSADQLTLASGDRPSGVTVTGGNNGAALVITLDADTTVSEVNAILNAIKYASTSDTASGERVITTTLSDGHATSDDGNVQSGGNAGGPDALSVDLVSKITIVEQNDPPASSDNTVTTNEDTTYVIKVSDFNYTQPGGENDTLGGVTINSITGTGTFKLDGNAITAPKFVTFAEINAGKLVYEPVANENGDARAEINFTVQDSRGLDATSSSDLTVNVTPQNDAPTFNNTVGVVTSVNESTDANKGVPATAIITGANIGDIDLSTTGALSGTVYGEGKITVAITSADASEQLTIDTSVLTGSALPSGVVVTGGVNGANLVITLDNDTTIAQVNEILNAIRYSTISDTFTGGERTITTTLSDGKVSTDDGNVQAGGNAGGPDALSVDLISKITVVEQNDPPASSDNTVTTNEDTTYVIKVSDFNYTQPGGENDTLGGVTINSITGTGTFKLDGNAITAPKFVTFAEINAGKLVYEPVANENGDARAEINFTVQDSRGLDATSSSDLTVNVTPQNDAPTFNNTVGVVTSVNESTDANKGVPATAIITGANIGDIDLSTTGALSGTVYGEGKITVAITSADASEQLTIDSSALPAGVTQTGGANGTNLVITLDANTTIAEVNAILDAIRYSTTSDTFTGGERTITTTLSDGKVSTDDGNVQAGGDADGPNALSVDLVSKITVVEKNDPPLGADQTVTTPEDTDYALKVTDFNYSQPGGESDTLKAVRIDTLPASGTLKLNGVAITAGTVVSVADITSGKLVYSPAANVNGDAAATFTFSVQDSRDGFDTTPKTVTVNITPLNDAPTFNNTVGVVTSVNESTDANKGVPATAIITGANIGDIDLSTTGALSGTVYGEGTITVAITGADASEQLTIDSSALPAGVTQTGGANGTNLVITLDANTTIAEVNAILDAIRYSTTSDTFTGGERTITTTLSDGKVSTDDGNVQAGGDAGGPNALSVDLVSKITVAEKNDPPVISGSPAVTATEDTDYAFKVSDFNYSQQGGESTVDTDLNKITIKTLPDSAKGKLLLQTGTSGGNPVYTEVAVGQEISAADISAGKLIYRADANLNGPEAQTSFTYSVWDKGHAASNNVAAESATGTMNVSVIAVNDAPVLSGTSESPAMVIKDDGTGTTSTAALASGVAVSDIDITKDGDVSSYGGGTITVTFTDGYQSGDRLTVNGGLLAGMTGVSGGNGSALVISLANDATSAQVKSIIEAIRYGSVDADPTAGKTDTTRAYSIVLNDGDNNADAGTIDGTNDAGGPTSLNSVALTGTITFRYPPTATDDTVTVSKTSTTGTGNVKTNDNDPEHTADPTHEADFTLTKVNGATGNVGKTITGTYGTITINSDGTYSYQLDTTNQAVIQQLPGDADLTESFTYQITDNDGQTDTATVHIKIVGTNLPPEATDNSNSVKVGNNETASGNVISDNDGDGVDKNTENVSQTLSVVGIKGATGNIGTPVAGTYGTITVNANGTYSYVLNTANSTVRNLPVGQTLTETFTYTLSDGIDTDVATVTITIEGPNASKPPSPPTPPTPTPGPGETPGSPDPGPGGTPGPGNDPYTKVVNTFGSGVDFHSPLINPVRLTLELQDRVATATGIQLFPLPATAFQHTDPTETLDIDASQPDGSPLPAFVNFNAQNMVFVVDGDAARLAGVKSVDIRVTGRDTRGNEATTTFTILFTDRNVAAPAEPGADNANGDGEQGNQDGQQSPDGNDANGDNGDQGNGNNTNGANSVKAPAADGNDRAEAPMTDSDALAGMAAKERMLSRIAVDAQAMNYGRHAILAEREALLADFAALFKG